KKSPFDRKTERASQHIVEKSQAVDPDKTVLAITIIFPSPVFLLGSQSVRSAASFGSNHPDRSPIGYIRANKENRQRKRFLSIFRHPQLIVAILTLLSSQNQKSSAHLPSIISYSSLLI